MAKKTFESHSHSELAGVRILFFTKKGGVFFAEHRHILVALQRAGAQVAIAAQKTSRDEGDSLRGKLASLKIAYHELPLSDYGLNPLLELRTLLCVARLFLRAHARRAHVQIVVAYTIKPIFHSALARLLLMPLLRLRLIGFFTGLGRAFTRRSIFHRILTSCLCFLLRGATQLWVLNEHNRNLLRKRIPSLADDILVSNDMGIDLRLGSNSDNSNNDDRWQNKRGEANNRRLGENTIRFLYLGRLLCAKGVGEYLAAARMLGSRPDSKPDSKLGSKIEQNTNQAQIGRVTSQVATSQVALEFLLAGESSPSDPDGFPMERIERARARGYISCYDGDIESSNALGSGYDFSVKREDVGRLLASVDCLVLPSYAEGLPRVILEAAAMRVPAIVARYDGFERAVWEDINACSAFTCACGDSEDLAYAMLRFARLPLKERRRMGDAAYNFVASNFSRAHARAFYLSSLTRASTSPR